MKAIPLHKSGPISGNYWRIENDEGVEIATFAAPAGVSDEAAALALLDEVLAATRAETVPTPADYRMAIRNHIDSEARSRGYSDGAALAGYTTSGVPHWAAEAAAFVAWRDAVWLHAHGEFNRILGGERVAPRIAELIAELPAALWPESEEAGG